MVDYAASVASLKNNNNVQAAKVMVAHCTVHTLRPLTQHLTLHCLFIFTDCRFIYVFPGHIFI